MARSRLGFDPGSEVFEQIPEATGVEIRSLKQLRQAAEKLFETLGPTTIAV